MNAARATRFSRGSALRVAIVASSCETLDGLEAYLRRAGLLTSGTRDIQQLPDLATRVVGIVAFPDDYETRTVISVLLQCQITSPNIFAVLVTQHPQSFEQVKWHEGSLRTLVAPKPAWGWTILDAIRAHIDGEPEPEKKF